MRVARFERRKAAAMAVVHRDAEAEHGEAIGEPAHNWTHFFNMNKEALDAELRRTVAELTRRLAAALSRGDLDAARGIWGDGDLASQIEMVVNAAHR